MSETKRESESVPATSLSHIAQALPGTPTLQQAVETFLRLGLLGKKDATVSWHRKRLGLMLEVLGGGQPVGAIMDADLMEWYAGLSCRRTRWGGASTHPQQEGGLSAYYLYSMIRCTRFFFKWLFGRGMIACNPAEQLALPRLPRTGRKGIADRDVEKILKAAQGNDHDEGVRDYALLRFLESTGARIEGIANLTLDHLDLDRPEPGCRRAIVSEKFDEERAVFMTPGALSALRAWLAIRPVIGDDRVFIGRSNGGAWHALSIDGLRGIVRRYAEQCGVKTKWSPHQWRHRFGRKLAEQGMSLGVISQLMGHKNISVTRDFYGIFASEELLGLYDRYMPDL